MNNLMRRQLTGSGSRFPSHGTTDQRGEPCRETALHLSRGTRNITLALPSELVRRARIIAAARDTSVSALVAEGLPMRVGQVTWSRARSHER